MKSVNDIAKELDIEAYKVQSYVSSVYNICIPSCDFNSPNITNEQYNDIKEHIAEFNEGVSPISLSQLAKELFVGTLTLSRFFTKNKLSISYDDVEQSIPMRFYELAKEKFSNQKERIVNYNISFIDLIKFDIIEYWTEIFRTKFPKWENDYDRMLFPKIPLNKLEKIRILYPFIKEKIYYIRGISNNLQNVFIITSIGFYEIRKEQFIWFKTWKELTHSSFFDDDFYFFSSDDDPNHIYSNCVFDQLDKEDNAIMAKLFSDIKTYILLVDLYTTNTNEFMFKSESYQSMGDKDAAAIIYLRAKYYYEQEKDVQRALFELGKVVMPDNAIKDNLYLDIFAIRADLYESIGKIKESRNNRILAFSRNNYESKVALDKVDKEYVQVLSELPQKDNSAIIFVDDLSYCIDENNNQIVDSISIFDIHNIPPQFRFKPNHPIKNRLYIRQGINDFFYVPYVMPENSFIERIKEFCYLLICLGATQINVKSIAGKKVSEFSTKELNVDGSASAKFNKGNVSQDIKNEKESIQNEKVEWEYTITARSRKEPYIPEDLFWYRTDWERLYNERMIGTLESYERLKNTMTTSFTTTDLLNIHADMEIILFKAEATMNKKIKRDYKEEVISEWVINYKFEPLSISPYKID